jgi:hypothetical protein
VVLWHAYPRIGLDARSSSIITATSRRTARFASRGQQLPSRRHPRLPRLQPLGHEHASRDTDDLEALAAWSRPSAPMASFLDTLDRGADGFRARLDAVRAGVAIEAKLRCRSNGCLTIT